jgi:hypothetical protein
MKTFVIASLAAVVTMAGLVDDADAFFGRRRARRSACCQTVQQDACCQPGMQGQYGMQGQDGMQGQYGQQGQPYGGPNQSFYRGDPSQAPAPPPAPEDFRPNSTNEAPALAPQQGGARIQGGGQIQGGNASGNAAGNVDL